MAREAERDLDDHFAVGGLAGARRVEIDHVDPGGAGLGERAGHRHRVVAVDRLVGIVALPQPDATPGPEVDGRVQLHHASWLAATKLASSRIPACPDFSG